MATFQTTAIVTSGTTFALASSDRLSVTASGSVVSTAGSGIVMNGLSGFVSIAGTVDAALTGVAVGNPSGTAGAGASNGNDLLVTGSGSVFGFSFGVVLADRDASLVNFGTISGNQGVMAGFFTNVDATDASINNAGQIIGMEHGLFLSSFTGTITNSGRISAASNDVSNSIGGFGFNAAAIMLLGDGIQLVNSATLSCSSDTGYGIAIQGNAARIVNTGLIVTASTSATIAAVTMATTTGQTATLLNGNSGLISTVLTAVLGGDGDELVINRGEIVGSILLGGGNDVFDGRGGRVAGSADGGIGDDTLTGGSFFDRLLGGDDLDVLNGQGEDDLLSGGAGTDILRGGDGADTLSAGDGNDLLFGGAGDDVMTGDGARDLMTGGTGADSFAFLLSADLGIGVTRDRIFDFEAGIDKIDLSAVQAGMAFIGAIAFSGVAGQIRYAQGTGTLSIDLNGDSVIDHQIGFGNQALLTAGDFIL